MGRSNTVNAERPGVLMSATRLSPLDASFLAVESPTAHMHVGWASTFKPPPDRPRPSFEELSDHIEGRLSLDPRFRQRLARVPLGLNAPVWIDDEQFEAGRHVVKAGSSTLTEVVDDCMSQQLERDRPLWQLCIADRLDDGRIGVVGKAHHCMVDGIAAVQLAALLLDPTPEPAQFEPGDWRPEPTPGAFRRLARGVLDQARGDARAWSGSRCGPPVPVKALRVASHGLRHGARDRGPAAPGPARRRS